MCGICGWFDRDGRVDPGPVRRMAAAMAHRGPDGEGFWEEPLGRLVLGHRRLAVVDLTERSHQPMVAASGSAISFNGEVYGFRDLRRDLEADGVEFKSEGDTEVVLESLVRWGTAALDRFNGQFALAFWDEPRQRLILVRDRLGIKPLFWASVGGGVVFASEIPALLQHPGVRRDLDEDSMVSWLQLGYGGGERTLVRGVRRLPPGHLLIVDDHGPRLKRWYDSLEAVSRRTEATPGPNEAAEELRSLLIDSVSRRLVADVPLGCFLSGGVDSGAVVGAAVAGGVRPGALTVRFEDGVDESGAAGFVARRFGLDHRVADCAAAGLEDRLKGWGRATGDPLADPSFLPTSLVAREARRDWTVALSGDGGDEPLSGYPRLRAMPRLETVLKAPRAVRRVPGAVLPRRRWAAKLEAAIRAPDRWFAYQALQGVWPAPDVARLTGRGEVPLPWDRSVIDRVSGLDSWTRWRALDVLTFLPERMLAKVDRASMAVSLEVRVPLLDHRVVEFLLAVDPRRTRGKKILRDAAAALGVPPRPRRKVGFEVPLGAWLRGPLREMIEGMTGRTVVDGLGLDRGVLGSVIEEHLRSSADHGERLLAVAVLVDWVEGVLQ